MIKNSAACFGEIPGGPIVGPLPFVSGLFNRPLETPRTQEITAVADRWAIQNSALCWIIPSSISEDVGLRLCFQNTINWAFRLKLYLCRAASQKDLCEGC